LITIHGLDSEQLSTPCIIKKIGLNESKKNFIQSLSIEVYN